MFGRHAQALAVIARILIAVMLFEQGEGLLRVLGPQEAEASNWVCGQDLNGDGYTDASGETASCIGAASGNQFCPVGAASCAATTAPADCPTPGILNSSTDKCEASGTPVGNFCPSTGVVHPDAATCSSVCKQQEACTAVVAGATFTGGGTTSGKGNVNTITVTGSNQINFSRYDCIVFGGCTLSSTFSVVVSGATVTGGAPAGCNDFRQMTITGNTATFIRDGCTSSITFSGPVSGIPFSGEFNAVLPNGSSLDFYNGASFVGRLTVSSTVYTCPSNPARPCSGTPASCTVPQACTDTLACPGGYVPNAAATMCEATPACASGSYDPLADACVVAYDICPLGAYPCENVSGTYQCSPNSCMDLDVTPPVIDDVDDDMLQDDGERDAEGNCLGQIYIFSGRGMRCRPPGMQVGYINDCCESDEAAISDSLGSYSNVSTAVQAIQTVYQMGQVAYYASTLTAYANLGSLSFSTVGASTTITYGSGALTSTLTVGAEVGTAIQSGITASAAAGGGVASTGGAITSALQSYVTALFNPATIIVAVVIMVVMKLLMGNGCDQQDIETVLLRDSGLCHYVGDYCAKKWALVGCVQKAKGFCCFNSKMARIIHEQGRPQLQSLAGGWGSAKKPNCRGFTPEEFQSLDFSKIDLSEYFGDIQTRAQSVIQNNLNNNVQQFYNSIQ